ncbi:hypothetical protein DL95DRAFT_484806, partial [Leptodontidium sp. 2 PMI_412]
YSSAPSPFPNSSPRSPVEVPEAPGIIAPRTRLKIEKEGGISASPFLADGMATVLEQEPGLMSLHSPLMSVPSPCSVLFAHLPSSRLAGAVLSSIFSLFSSPPLKSPSKTSTSSSLTFFPPGPAPSVYGLHFGHNSFTSTLLGEFSILAQRTRF